MKNKDGLLLTTVALISLTVLVSCFPPDHDGGSDTNALIKKSVDLHVVGNPKELKVITGPMPGCQAVNNPNGCIVVKGGNTALLNFELKTSPGWHFTKMVICRNGSKAGQDCNLDLMDRAQFEARLGTATKINPDANGVIDLTSLSTTLTAFDLHDENVKKQHYFYTLWVCEANQSDTCIATDPPIENGGKH